jgi:ATPase family associated with various cellular activities (AAA)
MNSSAPTQPALLPECKNYLGVTERLIKISEDSIRSFFFARKRGRPFAGFIRDSLLDGDVFSPSTGGLSVSAYLFEIEPELSYVDSNTDTRMSDIRNCRDESRAFFMRGPATIRKAFGSFNALTMSVAAYLSAVRLAPSKWSARTAFFNTVNLAHSLEGGWPKLENVDKAHPYVAYNVLRASAEVSGIDQLRALRKFLRDGNVARRSRVEFQDLKRNEAFERFRLCEKQLRGSANGKTLSVRLQDASSKFQEEAEQYLREQISYAPGTSGRTLDPNRYDPVGACFALNILERCSVSLHRDSAVKHLLGELGGLALRTVQHILDAISPEGNLPYGVPFSYDPKGTGAFATSVSGLAALARFLCRLLRNARTLGYPSRDMLTRLFADNAEGFQKLFSLAAIFESSPRERIIEGPSLLGAKEVHLRGWWTDRAPSNTRVESWVSIEVFLFAVYLREILQEFAQLGALRKYGGIWPASEPLWPYDARSNNVPIPPTSDDVLRDPDEGDASEDNPVPFLHRHFRQFMEPRRGPESTNAWKQEISSVLLFGPPGTSKTTTARSLARALGWHFLELTPSNFIIDGMELIEQRAKDIFDDLNLLRETVILFDELDSIFIDRERLEDGNILNFLVPAMLPKLQALTRRAKRQRLLVVITTNFYDRLDAAMVRRGRIDKHLLVLPYNAQARLRFLRDAFHHKLIGRRNEITEGTALYVYEELLELAGIARARDWFSGKRGVKENYPPAAIGPTLYMPRIPVGVLRLSRTRSTQRLALEVCEVVQRMNGDSRSIRPDEDVRVLIRKLDELEQSLPKRSRDIGWASLCQRLRQALHDAVSVSPPTQVKRSVEAPARFRPSAKPRVLSDKGGDA